MWYSYIYLCSKYGFGSTYDDEFLILLLSMRMLGSI